MLQTRLKHKYLGAEEMVRIWRFKHSNVGNDGVNFLMHDLKVTRVAEWEGSVGRKCFSPGERQVEEVTWDVHVRVTRTQRHYIRFTTLN